MRAVIGIGIEEEDRKHTWMEDADSVCPAVTLGFVGLVWFLIGAGDGTGAWAMEVGVIPRSPARVWPFCLSGGYCTGCLVLVWISVCVISTEIERLVKGTGR